MTATDISVRPPEARGASRQRGGLGSAAVRAGLDTASLVSPRLAGRLALELWRRPGRRAPVLPWEREVHEAARTSYVGRARPVVAYAWGDGRRPVLLVHGWGARASRFAGLVAALLGEGYSPVSYDAWGHGETPGPARTILDHQGVLAELSERHGRFDGVVAHSLGVPIALHAVGAGVEADRLVAVSGMGDFGYLVDAFRAGLGVRPQVAPALRRAIERAYFDGDPGIWERFSVGPLPGRELLVIHDVGDSVVERGQADLLVAAQGGAAGLLETAGLGHSRILRDPAVVAATVGFLTGREP